MDPDRIAELLRPFASSIELPSNIYLQVARYLDLLLLWNSRTNLTAIREPEQIVTRHFGESLFAAHLLFGLPDSPGPTALADVGSGPGFPGIPIKLAFPGLRVTLIESRNKKATFLKELIRSLGLNDVEVFTGRAERWGHTVDTITLRAVERFETIVPISVKLLRPGGRICLLIGASQSVRAERSLGSAVSWQVEKTMPDDRNTLVKVGTLRSA